MLTSTLGSSALRVRHVLCLSYLSPLCLFSCPCRWIVPGRYQTPSPLAPKEPPPVVFKPHKPSHNPLHSQDQVSAPPSPESLLQSYWPDAFIPNLITPLPWIRHRQPPPVLPLPWSPASVRCGVLARKVGMMPLWTDQGVRLAVTVLEVDSQVVRQNSSLVKGQVGVVLGIGRKKLKRVNKPDMVNYKKAGVYPKQRLMEFRVTPDALLPVGHIMNVRHFLPGQYVDVCGISTGLGHQGAMRRHGFGGLNASHGVSVSHRSLGSTGSAQDPGRVWKNKKMSGRMGNNRVTVLSLQLYRIDPQRNLLFVVGAVPGNVGGIIRVRDAVKKPFNEEEAIPPYPTYIPTSTDNNTDNRQTQTQTQTSRKQLIMPPSERGDPFAFGAT